MRQFEFSALCLGFSQSLSCCGPHRLQIGLQCVNVPVDFSVALHPDDAFEARLAVRAVAVDAQCAASLHAAGLAVNDLMEMRRCRAWAASTARQSDTALRTLLRNQATREKQLAKMHPVAMERAGWWFGEPVVPAPEPEPARRRNRPRRPRPARRHHWTSPRSPRPSSMR